MFRSLELKQSVYVVLTAILLTVGASYHAKAQSQAINGQIEGTVSDANGAAITNVSVTATNIETGTERQTTTDENGFYRLPLLPLGSYRITAETANFKKYVREGITLTTGQIATIDVALEAGNVSEVVNVNSDSPIADAGKIDVGRVMNEREVQNLPLVSRNPYNFALLQANVTGRPNAEFGVPRINANGYARRTNYQLDGNNNTQADRAGIRLMPISDTFVQEVQLVTNGFAAEFGNTPGLIMNAVTPQGTNRIKGSLGYRFRRTAFSSRPFFTSPLAPKPKTKVDNFTAAVGGPIIKDRWHYYGGYENVRRDLAGESIRVVTISEANKQRLIAAGVPATAFPSTIPTAQKVNFFILRSDFQINDIHRLTGRFNYFKNVSPDNIGGGLNTLQRSIDFNDVSYSPAVQLASTFSANLLNEFRFQYAKRDSQNVANANSGTGPSIVISGVANFGAPENADTILPLQVTTQFLNNLTVIRGQHAMKFGGGINIIDDTRRSGVFRRFTFPTIDAYLLALNGTNPRSYNNFQQSLGDPNIEFQSRFYNFFAQDDWKATSKLKINYGVRYDLYDVPNANSNAPFAFSRDFKVDKNNFAPRLGIVYGLRDGNRPTVIRASAGLYYEAPYLDIYLRALQNGGDRNRYFTVNLSNTATGAPNFPNGITSIGATTPSIDAVDPNYQNMYAMHGNVQLEQALTDNLSVTIGYIHSNGRRIPVYRDVNLINPVSFLADGRPVYSPTVSAATRQNPAFDHIYAVESVGNSNYDAATLQLTKRFSEGYQFSFNYTYSHAIDDAPEQNLVAATSFVQSDPTNRQRDRGNSFSDQRHTFVASFVGRPSFNIENRFLRQLVNGNQIGLIGTANSGETFNILSNLDLNRDGQNADRPLFIGRNTGRTPKQINFDMRFSRFLNFTERFRLEGFAEFTNVFNINTVAGVNGTLATNAAGVLTEPFPLAFRVRNPQPLDSRQMQLGFKFNF